MLLLVSLLVLASQVSPCMRTSPSEETPTLPVTTTTTIATTTACSGPDNDPSIFVSNSIDQNTDLRFGRIGTFAMPTATCPCADGTKYFFGMNTQSNWNMILRYNQHAFTLKCSGKPMCVCVSPSECYMPSTAGISLQLAPFCSGGTCALYMLIEANSNSDAMVPAPGSSGASITYGSQLGPKGAFLPLPGPYKQISAVGCGGCPVQMTC
ncbi:hypothetical protein QR680_005845 [Steinernema hermaphroditum]|uniref:Uncharacterized protein n=1 Tax=Steinernema hermaphroditum TaxID=289476 RepID=A0AA39HTJ5_9BILA|nr:hypothetical protein QR680_005845 [Steinernema hermaphroditum]